MSLEHILVVDDEKRIVENITLCLKREGFQATGAYDGDEALRIFKKQRFDLVLLDVSMPGMNGYEVMEHIFAIDKEALIIIITGYASVESAIKALKIGAWDYLKKPFEYADLVKTVKNALSQKKLIADKKAVSARLEASEKQYEYMVNNSPDLIFTLDQKGCFTFANHQFEKVLGFAKNDLIGTGFETIIHEEDLSKASILTGLKENDQLSYDQLSNDQLLTDGQDILLRFKKAETKISQYDPYESFAFMELKATPMNMPASDTRDEFIGVYAVARDVTERVTLEDQLRQAQKMDAIGTLAGGIAHDFNNILMGIQGYASLVKSEFEQGSNEYKRLANIDAYVFSGAEMARQLLGFAQKTSKETSLINLNYLLKITAKLFGRTKKDISIEQNLDKQLWGTLVDEGLIKQVLMNLFVNACQAMPGGGKMLIKSENVVVDESGIERSGAYVKVTVADTGVGIDEEIITRIFDPFFTTKERGKGTGLGLATAYGIIKSHKGIFKVKSKPGKGSAFMFFLPASRTKVTPGKVSVEKEMIFNGKGMVLLVDDEKGVIEVCSEMLEHLGFQVKAVSNGVEAIEFLKIKNQKIDLVILDMVMPLMNGEETFEKIRALDPEMRILVSSGYSRETEIEKMMKKGCNGFISKPFDIVKLSEKLNTIFKTT